MDNNYLTFLFNHPTKLQYPFDKYAARLNSKKHHMGAYIVYIFPSTTTCKGILYKMNARII